MKIKKNQAILAGLVSISLLFGGSSFGTQKQESTEVCVVLSETQIPLGGQTRTYVAVKNNGSEKIYVSEPKVSVPSVPRRCNLRAFGEGVSPMLEDLVY